MSNNLLPAALRRRRHVKTPSKNDRRSCCMAILQNYQTIVLPGDFDKPTKEMPQEKNSAKFTYRLEKKRIKWRCFPFIPNRRKRREN
jgi:hypothetical protein